MHKNEMPPKVVFGIRVTALVESLIFLGFFIFCSAWFENNNRFEDVYPHPFWIVVLLVSVQYGSREGVVATLLAILFLYIGNIPKQLVEETTFDYQFRLSLRPFLWFSAAIVLGELRMRIQRHLDQLTAERDIAQQHAQTITKSYELLKRTKENLESRVAGQIGTVAVTYETVRGLETLNPVQILNCLDVVVQTALKPVKFSVFASGPNGLEATTSQGWTNEDHFARRFPVDHPLYREIVEKKRLVCLLNTDDEKIFGGEGVMAAPLIDKNSEEVFGMVKLEEIDFFKLDIVNLEVFKTLCELIGSAYSNARKYKKAMSNAIYTEHPSVFSYNLFVLQKRYLEGLSSKTETPLSSLSVKVQQTKKLDDATEKALKSRLYRLLVGKLPDGVPIFHGEKREVAYLILLSAIDGKETEKLSLRILERINKDKALGKYRFDIKTETLYEPQQHKTLLP